MAMGKEGFVFVVGIVVVLAVLSFSVHSNSPTGMVVNDAGSGTVIENVRVVKSFALNSPSDTFTLAAGDEIAVTSQDTRYILTLAKAFYDDVLILVQPSDKLVSLKIKEVKTLDLNDDGANDLSLSVVDQGQDFVFMSLSKPGSMEFVPKVSSQKVSSQKDGSSKLSGAASASINPMSFVYVLGIAIAGVLLFLGYSVITAGYSKLKSAKPPRYFRKKSRNSRQDSFDLTVAEMKKQIEEVNRLLKK